MKKLFLLALPMLAVALPAPAAAQSGFRVELMAGFDSVKANTNEAAASPGNESFRGVVYGGTVGFDIASGAGLALGVDGEFSLGTADIGNGANEVSMGRDLYVGGRATARVSDTVSVYGRAGYTNMRLRFDNNAGNLTGAPDVAGNLNGVRVGLGVQISGDSNDYYGVEARYSDYEQGVSRRQIVGVIGARF